MAYARLNEGDVHVYYDSETGLYTCENCNLCLTKEVSLPSNIPMFPNSENDTIEVHMDFTCNEREQMADHLVSHKVIGDIVPQRALEQLGNKRFS